MVEIRCRWAMHADAKARVATTHSKAGCAYSLKVAAVYNSIVFANASLP